jgi:hypothetical protein
MNNPVPIEYVYSFTQANQSLMLHLATELLGEGRRIGNFQRFAELVQVQQDYDGDCDPARCPRLENFASDPARAFGQTRRNRRPHHLPLLG